MISNGMNRAEMIRWLGDAIRTETEKPFDEIDYDFVEECGCLLDELMGKTAVMTEEEARERLAKLIPAEESVARKKPVVKMRRMWKAIIAAAVVVCMGITVLAVPAIRMALMTALKLDVGDSIEFKGFTCLRNGVEKSYKSMEDLLKHEEFDFSLPQLQGENINLDKIVCIAETDITVLYFSDATILYEIWQNNSNLDVYIKHASEYHFNGYTTYVVPDGLFDSEKYYSYTLIDNDIHMIYSTLETIEILIGSID